MLRHFLNLYKVPKYFKITTFRNVYKCHIRTDYIVEICIADSRVDNRQLYDTLSHSQWRMTQQSALTLHSRYSDSVPPHAQHRYTCSLGCAQRAREGSGTFTRQPDSTMHADSQEQPTFETAYHLSAYCTLWPHIRIKITLICVQYIQTF